MCLCPNFQYIGFKLQFAFAVNLVNSQTHKLLSYWATFLSQNKIKAVNFNPKKIINFTYCLFVTFFIQFQDKFDDLSPLEQNQAADDFFQNVSLLRSSESLTSALKMFGKETKWFLFQCWLYYRSIAINGFLFFMCINILLHTDFMKLIIYSVFIQQC